MRSGTTSFVAVSLVVTMACGGGEKPATDDAAAAAAGTTAATVFTGQPVALAEQDVEGFLTVMREFKRLGLETRRDSDDPMSSVGAMATAWGANREAMAILRDNDFDIPRFQQVTYSVMMAMAASEMDGNSGNAQASAAQLEAMKGKVPPAQYEAMKKALEQSTQMVEAMSKQPEGNIELVKRFKEEIDALSR
jgi:hypothetical protein